MTGQRGSRQPKHQGRERIAVDPLLSQTVKDQGTMARVANPYSENEDSDAEDLDHTGARRRRRGSSSVRGGTIF